MAAGRNYSSQRASREAQGRDYNSRHAPRRAPSAARDRRRRGARTVGSVPRSPNNSPVPAGWAASARPVTFCELNTAQRWGIGFKAEPHTLWRREGSEVSFTSEKSAKKCPQVPLPNITVSSRIWAPCREQLPAEPSRYGIEPCSLQPRHLAQQSGSCPEHPHNGTASRMLEEVMESNGGW